MRFGRLLFCNATSDRLETGWVSPWGSGLLIWIETGLWKQGVSFLEVSKIKDKTGHIWVFGRLLFCNATSDRLETGWVTPWGGGLLIWMETGLWKQGVSFLELSSTSDSPETGWATHWSSGLLIWIGTGVWKQGVFFFYNYANLQIHVVICKFLKGFYFVISHQTVIFILFGNSTFNITQHFKGIVHPKMKILSSFTHPQVVSNLYEFLCSAEHKGRYFEECL